jgi:hypothetical protein
MPRTALLIRCDTEDADRIRSEARLHSTTMSSYVLQTLARTMESDERRKRAGGDMYDMRRTSEGKPATKSLSRTAIIVRCTDVEAERIRYDAKRHAIALNTFVVQSLKKVWGLQP